MQEWEESMSKNMIESEKTGNMPRRREITWGYVQRPAEDHQNAKAYQAGIVTLNIRAEHTTCYELAKKEEDIEGKEKRTTE